MPPFFVPWCPSPLDLDWLRAGAQHSAWEEHGTGGHEAGGDAAKRNQHTYVCLSFSILQRDLLRMKRRCLLRCCDTMRWRGSCRRKGGASWVVVGEDRSRMPGGKVRGRLDSGLSGLFKVELKWQWAWAREHTKKVCSGPPYIHVLLCLLGGAAVSQQSSRCGREKATWKCTAAIGWCAPGIVGCLLSMFHLLLPMAYSTRMPTVECYALEAPTVPENVAQFSESNNKHPVCNQD